jgi:hypothetical protein
MVATRAMSRRGNLAVGIAVGSVLAAGVVGCATSVNGTPRAASTPTTNSTSTNNTPPTSGSGSGSAASTFCQTIQPAWASQSFGVTGVKITPGPPENTGEVQTVVCDVTADGGFSSTILGQLYPSSTYTGQSVIQSAQQGLTADEGATNMRTLSGIGDSDIAFYCQTKNKAGGTNDVVFAVKTIPQGVAATELVVVSSVGQDKLIAFAKLVDAN